MTAPRRTFVSAAITLHGLDPAHIALQHHDVGNALFLYLDPDQTVSIRINLSHDDADLDRDRAALRELAELAAQAEREIARIQEGRTR
jgi:hypothetical protein